MQSAGIQETPFSYSIFILIINIRQYKGLIFDSPPGPKFTDRRPPAAQGNLLKKVSLRILPKLFES